MVRKADDRARLVTVLSYAVIGTWVISFTVDIFVPTYEPPASIHALMLVIAGGLFGEGIVRKTEPSTKSGEVEK